MINKIILATLLTLTPSLGVTPCNLEIQNKLANNFIKNIAFYGAEHAGDLLIDAPQTGTKLTTKHDMTTKTYTLLKLKNVALPKEFGVSNPEAKYSLLIFMPTGAVENYKKLLANILGIKSRYKWAKSHTSKALEDPNRIFQRMLEKLPPQHQNFFKDWSYIGTSNQNFTFENNSEGKTLKSLPFSTFFNTTEKLTLLVAALEQ